MKLNPRSLLPLFFLLYSIAGSSQILKKGNSIWSLGFGYPNLNASYYSTLEYHSDYIVNSYGPFNMKFEYMFTDRMGLGLGLNFVTYTATFTEIHTGLDSSGKPSDFIVNYKLTNIDANLLARFNYHLYTGEHSDLYAGLGAGYRYDKTITKITPADPLFNFKVAIALPIGLELGIGYRYFFNDKFGVYTELGLGKSILQFGLCMKGK
jgi:hypothetical protein